MNDTTTQGHGEDEVLEGVRAAIVRIEKTDSGGTGTEEWDFDSWTACACGHIYGATLTPGEVPSDSESILAVVKTDGLYERVMRAVIEANGLDIPKVRYVFEPTQVAEGRDLSAAVSDATERLAHDDGADLEYGDTRGAALALLRTTAAAIIAGHVTAMNAVKAGPED